MKASAYAVFLFALLVYPSYAQEPTTGKLVKGAVYSCVEDGVRTYRRDPIPNGDCRTINYSYLETNLQPDPSWTLLGVGDDITMFYRKKGLTRKGNNVGLWVLSDYKSNQSEAGVSGFLSSVARWTIDCQKTTISVDQATYYADHVGRGKPLGNWLPLGGGHPTYATPNSMGEMLMDIVCAKKQAHRGGA